LQRSESKSVRAVDRKTPAWDVAGSEEHARAVTIEKHLEYIVSPRPQRPPDATKAFGLSDDERELYLRVVADSLQIQRHYQLFLWLQGELQRFLPHEILISAWGNFTASQLNFDIVSRMPGVRTAELRQCDIDAFLTTAHRHWVKGGRKPTLTNATEFASAFKPSCDCQIHAALRMMRSLVIHGVRDERGSPECLYIALYTGSLTHGRPEERFTSLVDALIAPIDIASRKISMLPPLRAEPASKSRGDWLDLSIREQEILDLVCRGTTNVDIAMALSISPFTVKNHIQRILRKIGASNRTEAAAKYNQAMQELAKSV
jgi:transcriptional regulator EpsA